MDEAFYAEAQKVAEERLAGCQASLFDEDEEGDDAPESPACAPFCGCDTCIVREVLDAALPVIERGVRAELGGSGPATLRSV